MEKVRELAIKNFSNHNSGASILHLALKGGGGTGPYSASNQNFYLQNTPGLGIEYEVHVPAYFALLLNNHEGVEDFQLRSNVKEFGNLDDLLIDTKTADGEHLHFAFQLKHKENYNKNLLPTNFEAKGDFNLEKYCKAFKNLKPENQKYHFILYTNKNFDPTRCEEVTKFKMSPDDRCRGREFFNTSPDFGNIYKFEASDQSGGYEEFFSKFTLYTCQINFNDLDKAHILDVLQHREQFLRYVDFFRRWHRGEFSNKILDKNTLNVHLVDVFLSSFFVKNSRQSADLQLFEAAVQEFDITIFDDVKTSFFYDLKGAEVGDEDLLRIGKDYKLIDRSTTILETDIEVKLLCYFFKKPLIVEFNEISKCLIYKIMELYKPKDDKIKFILLGQGIDAKQFSKFNIFENLENLMTINSSLYRQIIKKCTLSLQRRKEILLEDIIERYEEINELVGPKEVFKMLENTYCIGGDEEILPPHYVPRTVITFLSLLDSGTILQHCIEKGEIMVINFDPKFENFKNMAQERGVKVAKIEDFLSEGHAVLNPTILTTEEECSKKNFDEIRQKTKNHLHHLKYVDESGFMLLASTQDSFKTQDFQLKKIFLEEKVIHDFCKSPINVLCAKPGMGKSTLLKCLKNRCSPEFWAIKIDLKAHNSFLKKKRNCDQILSYFTTLEEEEDAFSQKLKTIFLQRKKVALFLDGLDETDPECVDNILDFTKGTDQRVWLSSRKNLQQKLENYFDKFAIEIDKLSEERRKQYMRSSLQSRYEKEEIEEIVAKISSHLLGTPLQLAIMTQIFSDDRKYYQNLSENIFVSTRMYKLFFSSKYQYSSQKEESKYPHLTLGRAEDQLRKYEIPALQSLLNNDALKELDLDLRGNEEFLEEIKTKKDPLGVITGVNFERKAVFEHATFLEYFASTFLTHNWDKVRILQKHFFSKSYQNLSLTFNLMLAEESPLHLAVIHKDLDQIKRYFDPSALDRGGRNVLHLASCFGTYHPRLQLSNHGQVQDVSISKSFEKISSVEAEILELLLHSDIKPFAKDELFKLNPLEYALESGSLYAVEAILRNHEHPSNFSVILQKYYEDAVIAYYSLRFGYPKLLSVILSRRDFPVTSTTCRSLFEPQGNSILHYSVMKECANKTEVLKVLTDNPNTENRSFLYKWINGFKQKMKVDAVTPLGFRLLHFAAMAGDSKIVDFLLDRGANINVKTVVGYSPLFLAVQRKHIDVITLLLNRGADVDIKNGRYMETPLHWVVRFDSHNIEIMNILLSKGANPNARDIDGQYVLSSAVREGHFDVVDLLIKKGAKSRRGLLLHEAAEGADAQIISLLLKKGFKINSKNESC